MRQDQTHHELLIECFTLPTFLFSVVKQNIDYFGITGILEE